MTQPFRSGPAVAPPCTQCGAPRADLLNANGDRVCKGCAMTGEANLRLSAGRRSGKIGAVVGFFFGCGLILMSILWALVSFGGGGGLDLSARIFAIMLGGGLVIVFTCARNWKRLS